jgi:hypothetical protein
MNINVELKYDEKRIFDGNGVEALKKVDELLK